MNAYAQTIDRAPLERAVINVQRIIPAKGPGKPAAIKDLEGLSFGIWPDKLGIVREGESYEISFDTNVSAGVTYRNIKTIRTVERPGPAPAQFTSGLRDDHHHPASRAQAPEPQRQAAAPKPEGNGNGGNWYRPTAPRDSKNMFVCKIVGDFIRTGRVECHRDHLAQIITEVAAAYDMTREKDDR